jgi:hypothetical protein
VIGQAEIIVRAHVQDIPAVGDSNMCVLWRSDDSFRLVKTLRLYFFEGLRCLIFEVGQHSTGRLPDFDLESRKAGNLQSGRKGDEVNSDW